MSIKALHDQIKVKHDAIIQREKAKVEETKTEVKPAKTKDKLLSRVKIDDDEPTIEEEVKEVPKQAAPQMA